MYPKNSERMLTTHFSEVTIYTNASLFYNIPEHWYGHCPLLRVSLYHNASKSEEHKWWYAKTQYNNVKNICQFY